MNETSHRYVPVDAVINGRDFGEVLSRYVRYHTDAKKVAEEKGTNPDEVFADAMTGAIYQIYLLGVEDGMKGELS